MSKTQKPARRLSSSFAQAHHASSSCASFSGRPMTSIPFFRECATMTGHIHCAMNGLSVGEYQVS